jgi:hypothetical protein
MKRERMYRQKRSFPIPVWNGILEHCKKIGPAIWVFLWLLDKITDEKSKPGVGWCLGRAPIKLERIASDLYESSRTVQRHLLRLTKEGYIIRRRTPFGYSIGVRNSRKFGAFRRTTDRTEVSDHAADRHSSDRTEVSDQGADDRTETSAVTGQEWRSDPTELSGTNKTLQGQQGKLGQSSSKDTHVENTDDDRIEKLFNRAEKLLIDSGEDGTFVHFALDFLDRRSLELGKSPPATVNWYLAAYQHLKHDSSAMADVWQKVHRSQTLSEKYMPGFTGTPEDDLARQEFNKMFAEAAVR